MVFKCKSLLNYHFYTKTFTFWWDLQTPGWRFNHWLKTSLKSWLSRDKNFLSGLSVWACTTQFTFKFWAHDPICDTDFGSWWSQARWQIWKDYFTQQLHINLSSFLTQGDFACSALLNRASRYILIKSTVWLTLIWGLTGGKISLTQTTIFIVMLLYLLLYFLNYLQEIAAWATNQTVSPRLLLHTHQELEFAVIRLSHEYDPLGRTQD